MKKFVLLALVLGVFGIASTQALGIGAAWTPQFGLFQSGTGYGGGALSLKLDKSPYVFGIGASGSEGGFHIGVTADMWLANGNLIEFLNYYAGPGIFLGVGGNNNTLAIDGGLRIPLGINAKILKNLIEFYFELAPAFGVGIGNNVFQFPTIGLQGAFGFRFWF